MMHQGMTSDMLERGKAIAAQPVVQQKDGTILRFVTQSKLCVWGLPFAQYLAPAKISRRHKPLVT